MLSLKNMVVLALENMVVLALMKIGCAVFHEYLDVLSFMKIWLCFLS